MAYELPPIGHALSGGVAAALANVVIYPLDMATTRIQSQSTKDGASSRSLSAHLHGRNSAEKQQLQPIEFIKRPELPASASSSSSSSSSTSSATSSNVSVGEDGRKKTTKTIITTTTTTTRTLASSSSSSLPATRVHYTSVPDAIRKIYATEGFRALYSGLGSDTIATLTSNFVYFYVYMALRQRKEHRRKSGQLSTLQELFLGAEAGIISRFFTAPIHVVTTRQQVMGKDLQGSSSSSSSISKTGADNKNLQSKVSARSIIKDIYAQNGITGFWAGYAPTVILSINPSITYFLFETIKRLIVERQTKAVAGTNASKSVLAAAASLTSLQIFLISACSKAIASFLTYPLILTKTKLQTKKSDQEEEEDETKDRQENAHDLATLGSAEPGTPADALKEEPGSRGDDTDALADTKKERGYNGISDVIRTVIRDKGIAGLYTGCQGQVVKGFFSFGLMYMIKDRVVAWMLTIFLAIHKARNRVASS
ncbi:hypothetical protein BGZ70_006356 [Mortierella alpina]|uniref:Mitochondrial carrier n=1 Tax=Mortierella alpina TaxID=64518 RepID=A0A9P6J7W6_MORAP|nr:hypothetical protein BGZ70_006356 [Mortierella alpina]